MAQSALDPYAYARRILLPALGLQRHPFVIQAAGSGGTSSRALKITIERAPSLLLRFFDDAGRARRSARALRHLEDHGLAAPRLRHADIHWTNRLGRARGLPRYATAETWIDGTRAFEVKDQQAVAMMVAEILARFHAVTRPRWGRPGGLPEVRPYAATILGDAARMLRDLASRGIMAPGEAAGAGARLLAWKRALARLRTFHLVHNDANRRNFVLTPEKALVAIDVQRISYEPCAEEIANALYHFCRNDPALASRFITKYLEAAVPSCRETWERAGTFFTAFNTLKRLHRRTGPDAAKVVYADETAPGAPPGTDARIPQWKEAVVSLAPPAQFT